MSAHYDSIAHQYKKSRQLPFRIYVEEYTYFNMLGDIRGKSILDLACGEGLYTRKFKQKGAAQVIGVDISPKMIELAKDQENRELLDIEYIVGDVLELNQIGSFDLVVASYLLNYAQTRTQLLKMCQNIFINLKNDGRFITFNNNFKQPPTSYQLTEKYGFIKTFSEPLQEGTTVAIKYFIDGQSFTFNNYYFTHSTYEEIFCTVRFKEIKWQKPVVSPDGIREFGEDFWQDFLDYVPIIGIECRK
ncbi:class I SAM-dependent methyltransferase [Cronbergia sp. UHCC 0137]|uniref:class I SAM-dependent methyltransferase n=1 Tax=Cronbergia sp. UHCC 0137 TaxID=3110239 RepID=UPI002B1F5DDD|nr:class I SAM-dependent methyltransferase [Cronbergia sp. UHCC 0137]MEA5618258.1 class I SAM-dependent methyltransferase [Cronbergia sp. UHCC 0137]